MVKVDKWQFLVFGLCLTAFSAETWAGSLEMQRQDYQQAKQAWDSDNMVVVQQLMPRLRDYPLYPYLAYRQLTQDLTTASVAEISQFLQQYPTLPPAQSLASRFVNELARREEWYSLLTFHPQAPEQVSARCNYYYAKWMTGEQQIALQGVDQIWMSGKTLPGSCDKLLSAWQAAGKQTPLKTEARIKLALQEGNSSLVNALARQLPADVSTLAAELVRLKPDLASVESFARNVSPTGFTRAASTIVFANSAKQNVEKARAMIPVLVRLQKMNTSEKQVLEDAVAKHLMGNDVSYEQAQWRDQALLRSQSPALLERRARMALGKGDRQALNTWLARLPEESRQKEEWRYWHASSLFDLGKGAEGEEILRQLMKERGFYPMVAAQKLNEPYPVNVAVAAKANSGLGNSPEIARVRELMYWNMDNQARNEWRTLVASRSRLEQEALARYAFEQKWVELSVQATIVAKLWDHLEERFPMAWSQEFKRATEDKGITPSYAMAIARQESAWDPQARSPVGATGLMQVMPRTAEYTVQLFSIPGYSNQSQLFDPKTNITIGTHYLESVYQQFGRNRILSSAAYNAGPSRVNTWLENSDGRVDAVAFVESIPFNETRSYVKNVLAYDAFYRHFMNRPVKVLTDAEWQRRY